MTTQRATNERSLLPRGLIARRSFQFSIGQQVSFHDIYATITACQHTLRGEELYEIQIDCPDRPNRTVRGQYLQPLPAPYSAALMAA